MMSAQLQQSEAAGNKLSSSNTPTNPPAQPTAEGIASSLKNRAGDSKSPFVRAHIDTLVSWQLLDDEAVERAKRENKLIFMTIGYLASHYCHLARQESFSNPKIATILNQSFIPIVVDREERPDIDNIYMNYNHSLNNGGGWPLNLFLTPELEPVFGGTYWAGPGVRQRTETGGADEPLEFLVILKKLQDVWPAEEPRVREEVKQSVVDLRQYSGEGTLSGDEPDEVDLDQIEEAYTRIGGTFDPMFGGFGQEPKFPTTAKLSFLLRATRFPAQVRDVVGAHDCEYVSTMALHTLRRMLLGGMHDHVGGGFHRHSVTRDWSLPTFEKMLTDNSLLLGLYLDAWLLLGGGAPDGEFLATVLEIADYISSSPIAVSGGAGAGGFLTSEAADSYHRRGDKVKRQGAHYLWTRKEFDTVISSSSGSGSGSGSRVGGDSEASNSQVAAAHFDVQEHGNVDPSRDPNDEFLNQNVLRIVKNEARLNKQFNSSKNNKNGSGGNSISSNSSGSSGGGSGNQQIHRPSVGGEDRGVKTLIESVKQKLRAHRQRERVQPDLDTKIVTAYNGMAVAALARTAAALSHTADGTLLSAKARQYLDAAEKAARFIQRELWDDAKGTLYRAFSSSSSSSSPGSSDGGRMSVEAFAEDYAFVIEGLVELYEATADDSWLRWALRLQDRQIALFYDEPTTINSTTTTAASPARCGAFYSTRVDAPHVILRIKDAMDAAQPSANAVSASNLFRLGGLLTTTANDEATTRKGREYSEMARQTVRAFGVEMLEHPHLFPGLLCGVVPLKLGGRHWVVVGGGDEVKEEEFRRAFHKAPRSGLFTLAFVQQGQATANKLGLGIEGPGVYALDDKKEGKKFRKLGPGDPELREVVVSSGAGLG